MNITAHEFKISQKDREKIKDQNSMTIWMSGLSGSGKSTIANNLEFTLKNCEPILNPYRPFTSTD